ncbi:ABC transporter substrate-binding protein [Methylocapsa sp. D3K7]|uniref:ABC transporter substrate-binding protein n=1 Tax=Methylocapsa sp. D3K7 TaxID=3041435 RepID=UPI00244E6A32|nr:ABC transporter substrate-binding protein [Methylocapsa sp. D3K7]WGJ13001.1 ABC transporter substrate-binding protein [Methylocapsa sp. D3K7]
MLAVLSSTAVQAADRLRLAVQKTGTFAWELSIIKARGLDKKAGLEIEVTELAAPEASKVALLGGSVDIILSDWPWVARQRNLGGRPVFFPYSTALGAVMVETISPIKALTDLQGKKIAVAGGPLDKSWLLLQAFAREQHFDIASEATVIYGAPPLLYQKAVNGEADATLNYWTFCVALESRGFRRLIDMEEIEKRLGAKGPVAMVGYVFDEGFAGTHADALARFLKIAGEAREILAHSDADWDKIARQAGIEGSAQLALYRQTYIDGIPRRRVEEEAADARILYRALVTAGGADLAGPAKELDEKTYYKGGTGVAPGAN